MHGGSATGIVESDVMDHTSHAPLKRIGLQAVRIDFKFNTRARKLGEDVQQTGGSVILQTSSQVS